MNESVKRYDITLGGQKYSVMSDRSPEHITQATKLIEAAWQQMQSAAPQLDARRIAVMIALQMTSKFLDSQETQSLCQEQATHLIQLIQQALPPRVQL